VKSDYVPVSAIQKLFTKSPTMHPKRPAKCDIDWANSVLRWHSAYRSCSSFQR